MPLCTSCKYYTMSGLCTHIAAHSVVDGITTMNANDMRGVLGKCGPEGRLFAVDDITYPEPPKTGSSLGV